MRLLSLACVVFVSAIGCGGSVSSPSGSAAAGAESCDVAAALTGVTYDVSRSKFAFGCTATRKDAGTLTRWVGCDGVSSP
jgi:hypothetical protein